MCSAVSHTPLTTRGAESTAFTGEGHKLLMMTGITANTQKAILKTTTLQLILKLPGNVVLLRQQVLNLRPMRLYELVKQCGLWLMVLVLKWTNRQEVVLECIGWQDRKSLCSCNKQSYPSTAIALPAITV